MAARRAAECAGDQIYKLFTRNFSVSESKEGLLPGLVVEDGAPAERGRYRLFVGDDRVEVSCGVELGFHRADEAFKAAEAVEFVPVADLCGIERRLETRM